MRQRVTVSRCGPLRQIGGRPDDREVRPGVPRTALALPRARIVRSHRGSSGPAPARPGPRCNSPRRALTVHPATSRHAVEKSPQSFRSRITVSTYSCQTTRSDTGSCTTPAGDAGTPESGLARRLRQPGDAGTPESGPARRLRQPGDAGTPESGPARRLRQPGDAGTPESGPARRLRQPGDAGTPESGPARRLRQPGDAGTPESGPARRLAAGAGTPESGPARRLRHRPRDP